MRHLITIIVLVIILGSGALGSSSCRKMACLEKDSIEIVETSKKIKLAEYEIDSLNCLKAELQKRANKYSDLVVPKENKGLESKDLAALLISLLALMISYFVLRKENWNKNLDFISEIDKQFISDPTLWAVYDLEKDKYPLVKQISKQESEEERTGKLKAFCYYKLNNFDSVFLSTNRWSNNRKAWEAYMVHLIVESSLFKEIVTDASENYIYNIDYRKKLKKFLLLAATLEPTYNDYKTNQTSEKKAIYYATAKKILQVK